MPWDPDQYLRFKAERFRPFEDLVGLVERRQGMVVVDLGCGTGELTRRIADALDSADVIGVDNSAEMLAKAAEFERAGLRFELADLTAVEGTYDLVISNAAIQWVDDHPALLGRLWTMLAPGGQLCVQQPSNFDHPSQVIANDLALDLRFLGPTAGTSRAAAVLPPEKYCSFLWELGATDIDVFEKVYPVVLPDSDAIVEWMRGTALVPVMEALPEDGREPYLDAYRAAIANAFPGSPVLFTFKRTFFSARRP